MPACPKCGTEVSEPVKVWDFGPKGRKPIKMGLFKCPNCGHFFRKRVA